MTFTRVIKHQIEKLDKELISILTGSQRMENSKKLLEKFMKICKYWIEDESQFDVFKKSLIKSIDSVLIHDRTSPFTKRTLKFISSLFKELTDFEIKKDDERKQNIAISDAQNGVPMEIESENFDDELNEVLDHDQTIIDQRYLSPLLTMELVLQDVFLQRLNCGDANIRSNTLILINNVLEWLDELHEDILKKVIKTLIARLFDKDKIVRLQVINCLKRFQGLENEAVFSINNYLKVSITSDPDCSVRSSAIQAILITLDTIECILLATRDPIAHVRKVAFIKIADNSSLTNFKTFDRHKLLKNGLFDPSASVVDVTLKKLIPNWLGHLDNDMVNFLDYLSIDKEKEFCDKLLSSYFSSLLRTVASDDITKFHKLVFQFREKYLDESKLIKCELTMENTFFWFTLCQFCQTNSITYKKQVDSKEDSMEEGQNQKEEYIIIDLLDEILPDIPQYCLLLDHFVQNIVPTNGDSSVSVENSKKFSFIFRELLNMGKLYSIKDTAQWDHVVKSLKSIILNDDLYLTLEDYIEPIFVIFENYFKDDQERHLQFTLDLINTVNNPEMIDFDRHTKPFIENGTKKDSSSLESSFEESQMTTSSQDVGSGRIEQDSKILERCLEICNSFLHVGKPKKDLKMLSGLIGQIVLKNLASKESQKVRLLAIKALGNYCLPTIDAVNHFLKVFIEIIEEEKYLEARVESLRFLFDFVIFHGMAKLKYIDFKEFESSSRLDNSERSENFQDYFPNLLNNLLKEPLPYVLSRDPKIRIEYEMFESTVKGLSKILYLGRFHSPHFLAKLLLIYTTYENISEEVKQEMKLFFLRYSTMMNFYFELFNLDINPFCEAYLECCKLLIDENEDITLNQLRAITQIILNFVRNEDIKPWMLRTLEIFQLTYEKDIISINLELISGRLDGKNFEKDELWDICKHLEQFLQRYCSYYGLSEKEITSKRKDKVLKYIETIINRVKLFLKNGQNDSIVENDENEEIEMAQPEDELSDTEILSDLDLE